MLAFSIILITNNKLFQFFLNSFAFLFVARLVEQRKHIFLVGFYTRLVKRIYIEDISADATSFLEEINDFAEASFGEFGEGDVDVRHTAVHVSEHGAEFCHLVHLVDTLSGDIVKAVEISFIGREDRKSVV